jgi:translation initiation factor 2 gamma subunit (eIF-2gamma)
MIRRIPIEDKILEGPEFKYEPIIGTVLSIKSETNELNYAISGGLLGIQLTIDPAFARNDHLVGGLVLKTLDVEKSETEGSGSEPIVTIYDKIIVKVTSLLISEEELNKIMKDQEEIDKKEKDQRKDQSKIIININSNNIECSVHKYKKSKKELFLFLNTPIAIDSTDNIATIMHKNKSNNIIGRGIVVDGIQCIRL